MVNGAVRAQKSHENETSRILVLLLRTWYLSTDIHPHSTKEIERNFNGVMSNEVGCAVVLDEGKVTQKN